LQLARGGVPSDHDFRRVQVSYLWLTILTVNAINNRMTDSRGEERRAEQSDALSTILRSQRILLRGLVRTVRGADGLTLQQAALLRILVQNGPTSMNELSKELMVTPPNITGIVDRLEAKRLVKRTESKKDRRGTDIRLTAKGERLQLKIRQDYRESLKKSLGALDYDEQETLARLLKKLAGEVESPRTSVRNG
jgi:DNA-binding MarR family transcriptional regulator